MAETCDVVNGVCKTTDTVHAGVQAVAEHGSFMARHSLENAPSPALDGCSYILGLITSAIMALFGYGMV